MNEHIVNANSLASVMISAADLNKNRTTVTRDEETIAKENAYVESQLKGASNEMRAAYDLMIKSRDEFVKA